MNNDTIETPLDICNLALKKLGEPAINAIDPNGTPAQRLCYQHYHTCRWEVLCANNWRFARKTQERAFETKIDSETYGYTLPDDCLRVLEPSEGVTIRNRVLYCSEPEITLIYTADEEDVTKFEPIFAQALATRLAAKICMLLTHSIMMAGRLTNEYNKMNF